MKSHTYDFAVSDLMRLLAWPLIPAAAFAGLMHLGAAFRMLPAPRPTLDVDRTILIQKLESARRAQNAEVLLMGDSSCLMDVCARPLGERLNLRVLNLGTLSYLDLAAYGALLREYTKANPAAPRAVVLLLNPEALRRVAPEDYHVRLWHSLLEGSDFVPQFSLRAKLSHALGLEIFRGRVLARLVPTPLPGAYGRRHGYSDQLERFLSDHLGTAVDPDPKPFQGDADYRLAPQVEAASKAFRAALPRGAKLFVGITPVPEGFARADYPPRRDQMLRQLAQWLQAEAALGDLPATMPPGLFTKATHLNEAGAALYTEELARSLAPLLR